MRYILIAVIIELFFYGVGIVAARKTVANECKILGAFYVGKDVFKCVEITPKD